MINSLPDAEQREARFKKALAVVELHIRSIEQAEANVDTISTLRALLAYLKNLKEPAIAEILSKSVAQKKQSKVISRIEADDVTIANMPLGRVEEFVRDPAVPLVDLKRLAAVRFAFPPGTLSTLSRQRLTQRILDEAENEKTHETISRLAGRHDRPAKE